jgi:hypothetical protein
MDTVRNISRNGLELQLHRVECFIFHYSANNLDEKLSVSVPQEQFLMHIRQIRRSKSDKLYLWCWSAVRWDCVRQMRKIIRGVFKLSWNLEEDAHGMQNDPRLQLKMTSWHHQNWDQAYCYSSAPCKAFTNAPLPLSQQIRLVLLTHRNSPFYLQIPLAHINSLCLKPLKYLLFLGWCILRVDLTNYTVIQ